MGAWYSALFLAALTGAGLASCASSPPSRRASGGRLPAPNAEAVRAVGLTALQSDEGLKLYNAKCTRCHKSYDPHSYTAPQWESWMSKMSRKAHLDAQQQDLLLRYLEAVRATPPSQNSK
jgi:cytochrome c5